ncbi:glycosyltransferase family 2 protein [Ferrimicrobium acidiphilum]|uniref:glycosyltransferase family 2 protein n=2 Tax=Ferrimicrobium acidiphilum TaxID=121039 RepID=UPI0023F2DAEC|nr:glycosyltransferase family 2 protein [Ferrimicrobium acidiphilum]
MLGQEWARSWYLLLGMIRWDRFVDCERLSIGSNLFANIAVTWPLFIVVGEVYFAWRLFSARFRLVTADDCDPLAGVEVVIPAHNEALLLPRLLSALAHQQGVDFEVTVIDDRSTDATGQIALSHGARVLRLDRRRGNNPKAGALSVWSPRPGVETVVFMDADVDLVAEDALAKLVGLARSHPDDLVSVQPFHRMFRWYEQFAFYPNLVSLIASGAFSALGPGSSRATFGPVLCCQVVRYQEVGGHVAILESVLDDQALGERFWRWGGRTILLAGRGWIEFRMYPAGFASLFEGFRKNVARGALMVRGAGAGVAILMVAAQLSALVVIATSASKVLLLAVAVLAVTCASNTLVARRIGTFWWSSVVLQLLYLPVFVWIVATSGFDLVRGQTKWRGQSMRTRR